ncbi:uncharacterized protein prr36a [Brachyhypopomus gauderio]|uniref:uncharacterized protein prr36a n=1 Tax=Brachyhypopomus gauderio TaxID=698409 RepID=UPI004042A5E0
MKPDGADTAPAEPTEALEAQPGFEAPANEEQSQPAQSPSPPPPANINEAAGSTAAPTDKEANGQVPAPKNKTKAPVKTRPGPPGTKMTTTNAAASRSVAAQNTAARNLARTSANGANKRPMTSQPELKKTTHAAAAGRVQKGPPAVAKAAEKKPVGTTRSAGASMNSGPRPAATVPSTLSKRPATTTNSAAANPKTTAPRPASAPAAKPSVTASSKARPIPKTTRPATAPVPRSTTSTAPLKPTTTTTKPAASRTAASAPSTARSASSQPSKISATTATVKDVCKPSTSAMARKPVAPNSSTATRLAASKTSKPETTKPATAPKRLPADTKTTRTRPDESRPVPTRKIPPSPRNTSSRPAASKTGTGPSGLKPGSGSTSVSQKRQTTKPTQSVLPLVVKRVPTEEPSPEPAEPSLALEAADTVATTANVTNAESVPEVQGPLEVQVEQPDRQTAAPTELQGDVVVQLPDSEPSDVETVPNMEVVGAEPLGVQLMAESPIFPVLHPSVPEGQEACESDEDHIAVMAPAVQEVLPPEPATTSPFDGAVEDAVPPKGIDAAEKAEQIIHNDEDEEEEKEGSQQVSVSDMSGTQPTEESRPGSAGLAGSVWRAGGLASELDSEDVSCSQQGASELSAPGVLEGTESIDDLGDASLKGADGEGASAGSPDFEKVPDIPANEDEEDDDDDYDRVCDMEVGSERADDLHRQCHDNEDEEDEDVEMASEGITESGLESYGNADEDDFAEDYRLDNLNRMQGPPIAPPAAQWGQASPIAEPWLQPLQSDPALLSSPPSNPWQGDSETPTQIPAQAWLDVGKAGGPSSPHPPAFTEPTPSSPQYVPLHIAEMDVCLKPGSTPIPLNTSDSRTLSGPELLAHGSSDPSTPEELKDHNTSPGVENQQQQTVVINPTPVALPDIMQDLGICLEHADEEPETLPADDVLGGLGTAPTSAASSSSVTREASDTEGEMQISEPTTEPVAVGHECFSSTHIAQSLSVLQEREEASVEVEGGGGSDTPQSATSAASYGFDCTSNSNAQSTTESSAKSPGIFSLENEEQLLDEAKDPSLIKELTLTPTEAPGDADLHEVSQQGAHQPNSEQQYMLCGKATEEIPESGSLGADVASERGFANTTSSGHQDDDWDHDAQHPYYSTICEKTDSSLAGRMLCFLQPETATIDPIVLPKPRLRACVDHVTHLPGSPADLPPRVPSTGPNAQLRRLESHQQQLWEIERRREQQKQPVLRLEHEHKHEEVSEEEQEREKKEMELENQRRDLLQRQEELKQRQQIMEWQQELEQQNKQQSKQHKNPTTVIVSPSGLCTIYEALEPSEAEEDRKKVEEIATKVEMAECEGSSFKDMCVNMKTHSSPPKQNASPQSHSAVLGHTEDQTKLIPPATLDQNPLSTSHPPQWPCPPELDWGKKVDIVQQLINQTLLLAGDSCPPLLLTSAGGTLSPLETSLWPDLLPPITPPSATVTCVSSFSPEASGSSPQGEWTVVEVETHH